MSPVLPPVAPDVTAELVGALSPRLRKRLDAGVAKLAGRPVVVDGDTVHIAVDDDTDLELHAPGGVVTSADAIRCGCLLAPDCLHRAAVASAAPVADAAETTADTAPTAPSPDPEPTAPADSATPDQHSAAHTLHTAAAAVLDAGTDGAGAVLQAELLRAAHTARLAGLPRAAASAVAVVTGLRAARGADPSYRLTDLVTALRAVLGAAHRLPHATGPELAALRGSVRQPYTPDGSLRLYGLFSEPVLTAAGYAGAVTWTADAEGRLYTVSDVAPGGSGRAVGAAERAVRIGDTALSHRELSRAGLAVSGATVSPTGRLGAGKGVRAVRASGVAWDGEPLDRLWSVPAAEQAVRALSDDRHDLLFLDVTLLGTVREAAGDCLLADCGGLTVRLAAAHDHPALPYRDNLRLLSAAPGTRLRVVARLSPAPHARALLLATAHPTDPKARVDLGFDRLQHADLPTGAATPPSAPAPASNEPPLHLLRRRVHQTASGGRRVLAFPGDSAFDSRRLQRLGLATAGDLLDELHAAAADRDRDAFGRLVPADVDRFARAWLGAAHYTAEVDRALCAAAWGAEPGAI
ncbi:SWIM zinc finger family protein [Streptomyces cupreus]|uniref:SWIM zinc finger family protein n=1 Tax=Streptomyces cupreus TaxID=2759956 RepID=A0A7X1M6Z4_9ACTN|nr:SWIM zinc finger family protein [Streptomyces cupreus]MBC2900111.1 SWIM zinc finger family protein [Streptomyces cupreus]